MYDELYHHGIKGQKWGVRRFQKKDGSLTPAGKQRYDDSNFKDKTSNKEKPQLTKNKKATLRALEGVGDMLVADFVTAALVKAGMMELGVYANVASKVVIGWKTASDIADIYTKKD